MKSSYKIGVCMGMPYFGVGKVRVEAKGLFCQVVKRSATSKDSDN